MAVKPVVYDDTTKKHRPLGSGEKMDGLSASSIVSSQSGNIITTGSDGLAYATGSGIVDPAADNLLETTSSGKLKMDVDRLAEWLDGHPQAAAAIADAVKVVSEDSGNVIVQGTDKGAYLSGSAVASSIEGMASAQMQTLLASFADGQTIVVSGGKLVVDPTTAPKAKLQAIAAALRKAGGGLSVDSSTGKLSVDFASMDPAIMRAVVLSMVQQGGGIGVDSSGKLYVDFDSMPTDKFEAMLKSLKMLVPLDANKTLYVSTNNSAAGDTIIDGRGTAAKPFKTIQACVNYATSTYAVGNRRLTIRVVAGTYNENVSLPDFSRGTGYMEIVPDSGARDVIVVSQPSSHGTTGWTFACSGGVWHVHRIDARRTETPTTDKSQALGCYQCSGTGILHLYGFSATQRMPTSPVPLGGESYTVRLVNADSGGTIHIHHDELASVISTQKPSTGGPYVHPVNVSRGGALVLRGAYDDDYDPPLSPDISCSGSCDVFLRMFAVGVINGLGGGTLMNFTGSVSGQQYNLTGGSYVSADVGTIPGDANSGTIEESTYCWGLPDNQ